MDPRDEDDDFPSDESDDTEPRIRELHLEMVRLQAQIDQLVAAAEERAAEIAILQTRLDALEVQVAGIKAQYRKSVRLWTYLAAIYGSAVGMGVSFLMRLI